MSNWDSFIEKVALTNIDTSSLTASQAVVTDASKNLTSLAYSSSGTALALVQLDSNANAFANNFNAGLLSVTSSGGTTTLTNASPKNIVVAGSSNQTIQLPVVTTLNNGWEFIVTNNGGGGTVTVITSGGNTLVSNLGSGSIAWIKVLDTTAGTGTASWYVAYGTATSINGTFVVRTNSGQINASQTNSGVFASTSSNIASTGVNRYASSDIIFGIRNNANSGNLTLTKDTSDVLTWNGNSFRPGTVQSGTNIAAGDSILYSSQGTGTGATGKFRFQADVSGTGSGTSSHTQVDRLALNGSVTNLTSAAASTIITPTIASNSMAGGKVAYTIECSNGTDFQVISGEMFYSITNKAGTIAGTTSVMTSANQLTTGTLTATFAVTAAGLVQVTATTSLTPTILRITYSVENLGQQAITLP